MIKTLVKLEGLTIFLASLYFYSLLNASWLLFVLLWLLPDLFMLGYLKDKKTGSIVYNIVHNYMFVFIVTALGIFLQNNFIISLGVITLSHIGMDRFLGYGLKYAKGFKQTHIQRL